jgi:hypothetical protein
MLGYILATCIYGVTLLSLVLLAIPLLSISLQMPPSRIGIAETLRQRKICPKRLTEESPGKRFADNLANAA